MKFRFKYPQHLAIPTLVTLVLTGLMIVGSLVAFFKIQPQIPIFYSLPRKSQHLAAKQWLFLLPGISLVINLIHLLIMRSFHGADKLLIRLFAWTTVGMQILLGLAILRIVVIIT